MSDTSGRMIEQGWLGGGGTKGILVLQEWWGLVPHIKDVTERFAAEGYLALAPDFWDGEQTTAPDEAQRLFMALDVDNAAAKLRTAAAALRAHGATGKLGVVGFCMGGQLALYAATVLGDEIGAVVDFYGIHPRVKPDYTRLTAPVLGIFGEKDASVPPAAAHKLETDITAAGGSIDVHIYPADHAFFNDTRPEVHDKGAAADAWRQTLAFFKKHL